MKINSRLFGLLSIVLFAILTGCSVDVDDQIDTGRNLSFRLNFTGNDLSKTKSVTGLSVRYLLSDVNGMLLQDIQSDYHGDGGIIVMEPLPLGTYKLYVLAYDKDLESSGFRVNETPSSTREAWFSFAEQSVPVLSSDALFYGNKEFVVTTETSMNQSIDMGYVLAGVDVEKQVVSAYLRNSIQDIDLAIPESARFYSSLTVGGVYEGESACDNLNNSLKTNNGFGIMPQIGSDSIPVSFAITTQGHLGDRYKMFNTCRALFKQGVKSKISLDLSAHPHAKAGMLFISKSYYDEETRPLILQDDEPKSIFYDKSQRSFYINNLLQVSKTAQNNLRTRFYSPVAVKDVSIWSPAEKYGERILLAYYDSIPAFCGAEFVFSENIGQMEFLTDSKSKIRLTYNEVMALLDSGVEVDSPDPFWKKVQTIKPQWNITFSSFGGDPDAADGGPMGNWMGIRPVHIREGIAFLINFGYMISMSEFGDYLSTFQGQIWGNGGKDHIIDVNTIIPSFIRHSGFNLGLVYAGNGVNGLGGGRTLGVYQPSYFQHYNGGWQLTVWMHELGHCIGYSHDSGMTYGPWATGVADKYYFNNLIDFPVNSWTILNSRNNLNRY